MVRQRVAQREIVGRASPPPPVTSSRQAVAVFIRPQGGGLEYIAAPEAVRLVDVPAAPRCLSGLPAPGDGGA
ncbi:MULTISPECIES: hypothetical protein [unclassified Streptomyces]|uniref:hypothetical protein n=1 Tax=unclassified Streptomyces TaxID=2593676 RepID=UPI002E163D92|nr:hypothetical protein OG533_17455 [Streptomyces sp. NBC_01186]WSS42273.1 hypothetical protein OG220_18070 [Streptomyces sp. NBC_01187]